MNACETAADYLHKNEVAIINRWELRVRSELDAAQHSTSLVLRNHLLKLTEDLNILLRQNATNDFSLDSEHIADSIDIFEKHGRERATVSRYDENQLMREMSVFRQIIIDALFENHIANAVVIEKITRYFEALSWATVSAFSDSIKATQKKIMASLIHDLRNPLHAVQGGFELLSRMEKTPRLEKLFDNLRYSIHRISAILEEVLNTASIEAGKGLTLKFQNSNFADDLEILRRETEAIYGQRFKMRIQPAGEAIDAVIDTAILVRLLENLISNAFKHGSFDGDVTLTVRNEPDSIILAVHNTGEPIPKEKQEEIFDYLSTTKGGSAEEKGWGIGLALAKATAEGHKGTVNVESNASGTTFTLTIPKYARQPGETTTMFI
jgi:signal transduction histidine kinase